MSLNQRIIMRIEIIEHQLKEMVGNNLKSRQLRERLTAEANQKADKSLFYSELYRWMPKKNNFY